MRTLLLVLTFAFMLFVSRSADAQTHLTQELDSQAHQIYGSVMSPFCAGRLLQDCPSSEAAELKEKIRQMLQQGQSKQEITNYLYSMYGQGIRAAPQGQGFGLFAWIAPSLFLLGGFAFLFLWLKAKKIVQSGELEQIQNSNQAELSAAAKQRIEKELKDFGA